MNLIYVPQARHPRGPRHRSPASSRLLISPGATTIDLVLAWHLASIGFHVSFRQVDPVRFRRLRAFRATPSGTPRIAIPTACVCVCVCACVCVQLRVGHLLSPYSTMVALFSPLSSFVSRESSFPPLAPPLPGVYSQGTVDWQGTPRFTNESFDLLPFRVELRRRLLGFEVSRHSRGHSIP